MMSKAVKFEELFEIPTPDKKKIYTTVGYPQEQEASRGTIVLVHGLASTELWPPILLGSWHFRRSGFHYCRVNLYDWRPDARTLRTTDLLQHSKDVDTVVEHLKEGQFPEPFFAVGHSFGALTLLQAETSQFAAMSLWDPSSFISHPTSRTYKIDKESGAQFYPGAFELLISKRFEQGAKDFPDEIELARAISVPTQICYADGPQGVLKESSKRYFDNLTCHKELHAISDASHSFTEEGISEKLFSHTTKWFCKY
jgi:pimeloyl-ACP methyl ester carboxylesterase